MVSLLSSGIAGGLTNLSKMPACNLMLLGAQRRTLSGFSSTSLLPHTGFIYHCDVVQSLPPVSKYMYININNIQICIAGFLLANSLSAFLSSGPQEESCSSGSCKMHSGCSSGQFPWEFRWEGDEGYKINPVNTKSYNVNLEKSKKVWGLSNIGSSEM